MGVTFLAKTLASLWHKLAAGQSAFNRRVAMRTQRMLCSLYRHRASGFYFSHRKE